MRGSQHEKDSQAAQDFLAANPGAHSVCVGSVRRDRSGRETPLPCDCEHQACGVTGSGWVARQEKNAVHAAIEEAERQLAAEADRMERIAAAFAFIAIAVLIITGLWGDSIMTFVRGVFA